MINELPDPVLTPVYRLKAVLDTPLADGMFTGRELNGNLLPGGSAGWQFVLPDGTALGKIRHTLRTDSGALLNVQAVLARATPRWPRGWGEVRTSTPASTFRAATHIETAHGHNAFGPTVAGHGERAAVLRAPLPSDPAGISSVLLDADSTIG